MDKVMFNPVYATYNMLPKFEKLTQPIFLEKTRRIDKCFNNNKKIFWDFYTGNNIYRSIINYIIENSPNISHNSNVSSEELLIYHNPVERFDTLLKNYVYEDLVIHRINGGKNWTSCIHAIAPNGWFPEHVIGKSFEEIHNIVPGMRIDSSYSKKLLDACVNNGPYQRYVWGIVYDKQLNGHPAIPIVKFNPSKPQFWIRVETQIIIGFPEHNAFLFVLRQHLLPEADVDTNILFRTLYGMGRELRDYKGITSEFMNYLNGKE